MPVKPRVQSSKLYHYPNYIYSLYLVVTSCTCHCIRQQVKELAIQLWQTDTTRKLNLHFNLSHIYLVLRN